MSKEYVIELQHGPATKNEFINYFEKKVNDTITKYKLIKPNEKVGVAVSGGKDSITTLHLISKFMKKNNLGKPIALAIDEGIDGYRDKTLNILKEFCENENITLHIMSYKNVYNKSLDEIVPNLTKDISPCKICGVMRRQLLNKLANEQKIDVLATGHNLDDESQTIIMNIFKGNKDMLPRQGIITNPKEGFIRRIKPLYFLTDKEVRLYTYIKGWNIEYTECPNSKNSYRTHIEEMINDFESKFKGTKSSIVSTYLHFFHENNQNKSSDNIKINKCEQCGEPTNKLICKACELINQINLND